MSRASRLSRTDLGQRSSNKRSGIMPHRGNADGGQLPGMPASERVGRSSTPSEKTGSGGHSVRGVPRMPLAPLPIERNRRRLGQYSVDLRERREMPSSEHFWPYLVDLDHHIGR